MLLKRKLGISREPICIGSEGSEKCLHLDADMLISRHPVPDAVLGYSALHFSITGRRLKIARRNISAALFRTLFAQNSCLGGRVRVSLIQDRVNGTFRPFDLGHKDRAPLEVMAVCSSSADRLFCAR